MAKKTLDELKAHYPDMEIEEVDIMTNPARSLRDGVRMIPCLKSENDQLSGIFLSRAAIEKFLKKSNKQT
ncbi:MAG: hypothetical protein ABFS19_09405 [Thermodesulfobacteriota bacterium]